MKTRHTLVMIGGLVAASLWASAQEKLPVQPPPARFSFSENWVAYIFRFQDGSIAGEDPQSYSATLNATATLSGLNTNDFDENTFFRLSLGDVLMEQFFGDDPSYFRGRTFVTFTNSYPDPDTGQPRVAGRLTVSWTAATLTLSGTLTEWDGLTTIVAPRHEGIAGPTNAAVDGEIALGGLAGWWWESLGRVYYSGSTTLSMTQDGFERSSVQVTGQPDTTAPTVSITSPPANSRMTTNLVNVQGAASDNKELSLIAAWANDGDPVYVTAKLLSTNWTVQLPLRPGPNSIKAQSRDWSGNTSTVASVTVTYVLTHPLTLGTNGPGTINRSWSGGNTLELGQTYTVTGVPLSGSGFINWTDGQGNPLTNTASYTFVMRSNLVLVANFGDMQRPTLSITSPTPGQRVSNALVTVTGTASDNVAVTEVLFRLNSNDWASARGWSNWLADQLVLTPGTNTFRAYARDARGNTSLTNSVSFIYVLSDRLTLRTNPPVGGTVSGVAGGQFLEIGRGYSATATANSGLGYAFTNWARTTNGTDWATSSVPALTFTMQSNLFLQANFTDVRRPELAITNPPAGLRVSNAVVDVKGWARDNNRVTNVAVSLNGGPWTNATTLNNWSTWTLANVVLQPATNWVRAYATDATGLQSPVVSNLLIYVLSDRLTLRTNPPAGGSVSGVASGQFLEINRGYTATASANAGQGFAFANWARTTNGTDWVTSNVPALSFTMQSNLFLQANFTDARPPVLTITSPTSGQRVSNATWTVSGTASDNLGVAEVWYQHNSNDWGQARSGNLWSVESLVLVPGTNTFRAYAKDATGNRSLTNSVSFIYVLSDRLILRTNPAAGGTISGVASGQLLEINRGYTATASANAGLGFAFTNWARTTNGTDWVTSSVPALSFTMQSNLTLVASFADRQVPTLTVTNLTVWQRVSNALFAVKGRAGDNVGVSNVWYQVNSNGWALAQGSNVWTAPLDLRVRTNLFEAYAQDTAGNRSVTQRVNLIYVKSDRLRVGAVGQGTLSPNHSNAVLEVGQGYSVTASGVNGHQFSHWVTATNWGPGVTGRVAVLNFTMQSNLTLTVVFADTQVPTLTVTNLAAWQRVSNALFAVKGRAGDNVGVSNVWYQVNSNGWGLAQGSNVWTAPLDLRVRTNLFEAYAQDTAGNRSVTQRVNLIYVKSDRLRVAAVGQGTLSPNYSNAVLEVGQGYSVTASGVNGHQFNHWVTATNWGPGVTSRVAVLNFTMQSNLTLTVVFADTQVPTLTVTNLAAWQRVSNALFAVKGRAGDNVGVSNVWYQVNSNGWALAQGSNVWTAPLDLRVRTNLFEAYAQDAAGTRSVTQRVNLIYVMTGQITLVTNGVGTINRNFAGNVLEVGQNYTVTASAGTGNLFSNWVDGAGQALTTNAALTFAMRSNLVLRANFVTNPFAALRGQHNGLFYPLSKDAAGTTSSTNAGYFSLQLGDQGLFSGQLLLEGQTLSFSGGFNLALLAQVNVPRSGRPALQLNLQLTPGTNALTGWVSGPGWQSELLAFRAAASAGLYAGAYTMDVMPDLSPGTPRGDGAATVTVSASGAIQMSGTLADSAVLSQSTAVATNGFWPLYVSLYGGRGLLIGWLSLNSNAEPAMVFWRKPAVAGDTFYPNGFVEYPLVELARWRAPGSGQSAVNWRYGQLTVQFGNLPGVLTSYLVVTNNQVRVWGATISNLTMTINSANGQFSGSFLHPVTRTTKTFQGVLVQEAGQETAGAGWFLGANESGAVHLMSSTQMPPEDWVPASLSGKLATVRPSGVASPFVLCFGASTFSQTNSVPTTNFGMGTYSYSKLSVSNARVTLTYADPPAINGQVITVDLSFTNAGQGVFSNRNDHSTGSFLIQDQPTLGPASLAFSNILVHTESGPVTIAFSGNGFTESGPDAGSGTYTYARSSPVGALLQLLYASPPQRAGERSYVECTFLTPITGTYVSTFYGFQNPMPELSYGAFFLVP